MTNIDQALSSYLLARQHQEDYVDKAKTPAHNVERKACTILEVGRARADFAMHKRVVAQRSAGDVAN